MSSGKPLAADPGLTASLGDRARHVVPSKTTVNQYVDLLVSCP
jgi:hypothetical protein